MFLLLFLYFRLDSLQYLNNLIKPKYLQPQTQMDTLKTKKKSLKYVHLFSLRKAMPLP